MSGIRNLTGICHDLRMKLIYRIKCEANECRHSPQSELVEHEEKEPVDEVGWIVRRISELGGYESISDSVKADVFGFDIADVSGSIRMFSEVMKRLGIKLDGDEMYEEFQRIYDESVGRDVGKDKAEDKMWNRGRGR